MPWLSPRLRLIKMLTASSRLLVVLERIHILWLLWQVAELPENRGELLPFKCEEQHRFLRVSSNLPHLHGFPDQNSLLQSNLRIILRREAVHIE